MKIKTHSWSPDACIGNALATGKFQRSQIVCTKTLYNYIDLGLLAVINADLPMKPRRNTKPSRVKKHKKKLGKSIAERPSSIDNREEFRVIFEELMNKNLLHLSDKILYLPQ